MDKFLGKRLDGRYEIREIIGVGGMAVVYKAYDCIEDRIVAVKILKEEFVSNEEFLRRFKNESKAIAVLSHPNIVKVYDVSFGDLIQYIVMEYIDGITLKQYIEKRGTLPWKDAIFLTVQILRALQHAHDKGIVHRDVKPQNIMILSDGTIKVADFGIARFARSEHKTMTDKAIGSVHYISPEQARGEATDEKTDIYSVGVILYEMITGQLPFQADSAVSVAIMQLQTEPRLPREINDTIPVGLEQITIHAMQKDSKVRYKSAAEMLRDLEEIKRNPEIQFEYTYFVDNEPTRFVDDFGTKQEEETQTVSKNESKKKNDVYDDEEQEKSPIIPILAGVAVAFIIAAVAGVFLFIKYWGNTSESVPVPKLVGTSYEALYNNEMYKDYTFSVDYQHSSEYDSGIIIKQSPNSDRTIKKSQTISIVVSLGKKQIEVPDVYNLPIATAKQVIKDKLFKVDIVYRTDDDVAAGNVIATMPGSGDNAYEGDTITVYVSQGAEVTMVPYDTFVGLNVTDAKKKIEKAGLKVGEITYVDSTAKTDTVVAQDPAYKIGEKIEMNTPINLEISNGTLSAMHSYELTVDLPSNLANNEISLIAWVDGEQVHTSSVMDANIKKNYTFTVESRKETVEVRIQIKDEAGQKFYLGTYNVNFVENTHEFDAEDITPYLENSATQG